MTGSQAWGASLLHLRSIFKVGHSKLVWCVFKPKLSAESGKIVKNTKNAIFSPKRWWVQIPAEVVFYENQYFNILSVI